mmetsp:Transcript_17844/g.45070  ORF Transcript_17844/g.45070 Transcript_17844/m.45070 type:complete len:272 (-) Transcript_17844:3356-4171(-)
MPKLLLEDEESVGHVGLEQLKNHLLSLSAVLLTPHHPRLHKVPPLLDLGDEENTSPRRRCGCGILEISELKDEAHVRLHDDTLIGSKGKELIVVHDTVHRLDPVGIKVTIKDDPLGISPRSIGVLTKQQREDAILPLPRGEVDVAIKLRRSDGLGVQILYRRLEPPLAVGCRKDLPASRLACPGRSHDKVAVPDSKQLHKLNRLEKSLVLRLKPSLNKALLDLLLKIPVTLSRHIDAREEIPKKPHEDDEIITNNLGKVEVTQGAEQEGQL